MSNPPVDSLRSDTASDSSAHLQAYPLTDLGVSPGNQDNGSFAVNGGKARDGAGRGRFAMRRSWNGAGAIDLGGLPGALGGQGRQSTVSRGRRAKAATFREGDCGGTALNPASIGRIANSLFCSCYLPVIPLIPPC